MTEATGIVGEFQALKAEADADVLAMQLGDFYEFFGDDAELVGEELDLQLSQKSSGGETYPMAGVPVDELTPYLKALVERGYRVAVADQYEDGGDIEREVTRVVTPGTLLSTTDADARYLAAVVEADESGDADAAYGLAFADVTTGRFQVTGAADRDAALTELYRFDPVEVLAGPDLRSDDDFLDAVRDRLDATLSLHETGTFAPRQAAHRTREQFGDETLDSLGLAETAPQVRAAGAVVDYVDSTGPGGNDSPGVLAAMTRLQPYSGDDHVTLDATTQRNLELLETMRGDRSGSLFDTLDQTETGAGGRLLREWLTRPRRDPGELRRRQEGVAALASSALAREELREVLGDAYDLERLASRATGGRADAGDLLQVRDSLGVLPVLREAVDADPRLSDSPVADVLARPDGERVETLRDELDAALAADPPATLTDGGLLRRGYDEDLDELLDRHAELEDWFDNLEERVKRQYGLTHVTVDRNATDGYYVQIGKSEADGAPDHFENIKTLKNSERFTFDELAEKERALFRVEEERADLEYELFCELRERVADAADLLQAVGRTLAEVDVLASLAVHAVENDWTRPELDRGDALEIEQGRHPVVEQTTDFVPNDAAFDDDRRFLVVTGPNMSGKSTYLRQTALIVLLAQVGSFVPADSARIGLVDGVFTRVGALDELAQGRSTFMVEMQELSNILHAATDDSLVILDEVGRGTATYDGISIAWAATEYLHNEVRAKTLFATHYHELTTLADHLDRVANVHVAADESRGEVTFLRTVREGPTDRSYGIHVADLAGVPVPVVDRAREVLTRLREEKAIEARGSGGSETVQAVFDLGSGEFQGRDESANGQTDDDALDPATAEVLDELESLSVDETPPVELLAKVQDWQERLDEPCDET
jgi:DNA mismatch repair protein MutS